jgi:hypothetical protein
MPSLSSRLSSAGVVARGTVAVCVDRPAQAALPVLQAPVVLRAKLARAGWPVPLVVEVEAVPGVLLALRAKAVPGVPLVLEVEAVPGVLLALRVKAVRPVLLERPGLRAVRSSARAISIGGSPSFNA